jgi:hypothetical protein
LALGEQAENDHKIAELGTVFWQISRMVDDDVYAKRPERGTSLANQLN